MKRSYRFVKSAGTVQCTVGAGREVTLPVFPGILKHPTVDELRQLLARASPAPGTSFASSWHELRQLLARPAVARKYTILALRKAPWQVLREFPRDWLETCLREANLRQGRENALRFLLS